MYTSYIGKKFLSLYRRRKGLPDEYSAEQFFDEVLFPLFFTDEAHLMHVGNSPFFQKPTAEAIQAAGSKTFAQYNNFKEKIANGAPSGAIYVGYGAEGSSATSSGQLSDIAVRIDGEEMHASWIGQALAVGLSGGYVVLLDKEDVLWGLYEGWALYRQLLEQTPKLKDKQIETWNGNWFCHRFGQTYDADAPSAEFKLSMDTSIATVDWTAIMFTLARQYPKQVLTLYAYQLSQTNTTLGFINVYLPQVQKLWEVQAALFGPSDQTLQKWYAPEWRFWVACQMGSIGLKALEPKDLKTYMPEGSVPFAKGKALNFNNEEDFSRFKLYKIWISAMLNNKKDLNALAAELAQALVAFEGQKTRTNVRSSLVSTLLDSKNQRDFIEKLTSILEEDAGQAELFKTIKDKAIIELPTDLFPLFLTLIRFERQYQKSVQA